MFFGSTAQAAEQIWLFIPFFLGPILLFVFAPWVIKKTVIISKQENFPSLASFIHSRYGKSKKIAFAITVACVGGLIPYLALQIKAVSTGLVTFFGITSGSALAPLGFTLVLAITGILIVARKTSISARLPALMLVIAADSLLKLLVFIVIGLMVLYGAYDGVFDLWMQARNSVELEEYWSQAVNWPQLVIQSCVAMMAIYTMPHMFHVSAVENSSTADLRIARWLFPAFLILVAFLVTPITLAGLLQLPDHSPESFIFTLPLALNSPKLALLAFLVSSSSAITMAIVILVALSNIVTENFLPNAVNKKQNEKNSKTSNLWRTRINQASIFGILSLAYGCYLTLEADVGLVTIGVTSFAAITQLAPAMIGALIWKQANRRGVLAGIIVGLTLWFMTLALPLFNSDITIYGLSWLLNEPFSGITDPVTVGVTLSLLGNFATFALVSLFSRTRVSEHWQANRFIGLNVGTKAPLAVQVGDLLTLASRFVGNDRAKQSFIRFAYTQGVGFNTNETASSDWIAHTERLLTGVLGSSSTKVVIEAALEGREMHVEDVVRIVGEASEALQFNRTLLQGAIENITQGISVVDRSLRLVAWNTRYLELFDYPDDLVNVGRPIADIIRHNAQKGLCGPGDVESHVSKRLYWMRQGTAHTSERTFPNGRVIELIGNPMPGGGFVMSFTDITAFREAERALKEANESLEQRVSERTRELSLLNLELTQAKRLAEEANQSKTRFLAAVSHDLMQPLNAARLFSAALSHQEALPKEAIELVQNLDSSLNSAEDLISDLLDISRIEGGSISPNIQPFALSSWLEMLSTEFCALAQQQGIDFRWRSSKLLVNSDAKLLRRIVQNFLTNSFRYAQGQVLLGIRRSGSHIRIEVWDKGQGIPAEKLKFIFEEFKRLDSHQTREEKGLGLGLAIADGFSKVLNHDINVKSWVGKGSVFSVKVPIYHGQIQQSKPQPKAITNDQSKIGIQVLCIDNEESILSGMHGLLSRWGYQVFTARNQEECTQLIKQEQINPAFVLIDYHLDNGMTGVKLMHWLRQEVNPQLAGVVISADNRSEVMDDVKQANLDFAAKPVKPAVLRALINRFG